uniref:Uncharacterized protein n=1 Tax=Rhipicephalus microplus TaxID=6941 RepID=A0A6G5A0V8_RHIMP
MASAMSFTHFLLFLQVSAEVLDRNYGVFICRFHAKCYLIVLCPTQMIPFGRNVLFASYGVFRSTFYLFFLCGDVELNPGPAVDSKLQQLLDGQSAIKEKLSAIEVAQAENRVAIGELGGRIATLETKLSNIDHLNGAILDSVKKQKTKEEIESLTRKVDELENRSRRHNLDFYGVKDTEGNETSKNRRST